MTDIWTPAVRALVVATLLLATTALIFVALATAHAAGALAVGKCGAYGQAYDFPDTGTARDSARLQCQGASCRVVATVKRGCAALAVDGTNPCGAQGWAKGPRLGRAQNDALRACYNGGGRDCVIRTFICDAKG